MTFELLDRSYRYGMKKPTISSSSALCNDLRVWELGKCEFVMAGYDETKQEGSIWSVSQSGALLEEDVYAVSGSWIFLYYWLSRP
jgi:hypothetical protein